VTAGLFENDDRIRNHVFGWARTRFPFHTTSAKKLTLNQTPVVTVIGKAYFDVGYSFKDQRSKIKPQKSSSDHAAWEIHPLMKIRFPKLDELMKAAGKKYEPVIYTGAGHGFMRSGEPNDSNVREGDKRARDEAWARWKTLLKQLPKSVVGFSAGYR